MIGGMGAVARIVAVLVAVVVLAGVGAYALANAGGPDTDPREPIRIGDGASGPAEPGATLEPRPTARPTPRPTSRPTARPVSPPVDDDVPVVPPRPTPVDDDDDDDDRDDEDGPDDD